MRGPLASVALVALSAGCLTNGSDLFNARAPIECPGVTVALGAEVVGGALRLRATYANGMDVEVNVLRPLEGRSVDLVFLDPAGQSLPRSPPVDAMGPLRDGDFLRIPPGGTSTVEIPLAGDVAGAARVVLRERATLPDDRTTAAFCRGMPEASADVPAA